MTRRRTYGTGSLFEKHGAWYGRWRTPDGRRLSRRVGPVRQPGTADGLNRREAEQQLRKLMLAEEAEPTLSTLCQALRPPTSEICALRPQRLGRSACCTREPVTDDRRSSPATT